MGDWENIAIKQDLQFYNTIRLHDAISGTGATNKTCLVGVYSDGDHWITKTFLNGCPQGYSPVFRIRAYGYTTSGGYVSIIFNNIIANLGSWGPTTYTKDSTTNWYKVSALVVEDNAYGLSGMTYGGYNLYYQAVNTTSDWKIDYICLDLAYKCDFTEYKWIRKA